MEQQEYKTDIYYVEFKFWDKILNFSDGIYVVARKNIYASDYSSYGGEVIGKVLTKDYHNEKDFENAIKIMEKLTTDFVKEYCDWLIEKKSVEGNIINKVVNKKWGKMPPEPKKGGLSAKFYSNSCAYY